MAFTSSKMAGLIPRHRIDVINHHFELHKDLTDVSIDARERAAQQGVELIETLKLALEQAPDTVDRAPWEELAKKAIDQFHKKKAIIGIVGGTGVGKTSFINALLDEETLLPTNCMRACTATITEICYNEGTTKYRAVIEFLSRADWQDELMRGFEMLFDHNGRIVKDATNEDSEAGIFYAKIRAIYSDLTRDGLGESTIDSLLSHADVKVLDRTEDIQEDSASRFADKLQRIVDSKDRSTRVSNKDVAYWPIIKRVRLYVRAKVLATGVTLVDLPGIQDSTPARAKVAEDYMKSCSGLIVTAPIHGAKDDRVAKNLLGPTFRRQLMMDGGYSTMTFACTKIDEINIREMVNTVDAIKREVEYLTVSINSKRQERESVEIQLQGVTPKLAEAEKKLFETNAKCDIYEDLAGESRHMFTTTSASNRNGKRKLTEAAGDVGDDGDGRAQRKRLQTGRLQG